MAVKGGIFEPNFLGLTIQPAALCTGVTISLEAVLFERWPFYTGGLSIQVATWYQGHKRNSLVTLQENQSCI